MGGAHGSSMDGKGQGKCRTNLGTLMVYCILSG